MRKYLKNISELILTVLLALGVVFFQSCERVKNTADNISAAEGYGLSSSAILNSLSAAAEIYAQAELHPKIVASIADAGFIIWKDSSFLDGNGIEFLLDFGSFSTNPKGNLGGDGLYRAGTIEVKASISYMEANSNYTLEFKDFYIGSENALNRVQGLLKLKRVDDKTFELDLNNTAIQTANSESTHILNGVYTIVQTLGIQTANLIDDEYVLRGQGKGTLPNSMEYSWQIDNNIPLAKRVENGCASTFVQGVVNISLNGSSANTLSLDFDPYDNKACDKVAKVLIGNKTYIVSVN